MNVNKRNKNFFLGQTKIHLPLDQTKARFGYIMRRPTSVENTLCSEAMKGDEEDDSK